MKSLLLLALLTIGAFAQSAPPVSLGGSVGITGNVSLEGQNNLVMTSNSVTLTALQWWAGTQYVTGTLTATGTITLPLNQGQQYQIINAATGGFAINVGGASGSTVPVPPGATVTVVCNGTGYTGNPPVAVGTAGQGLFTNAAGTGYIPATFSGDCTFSATTPGLSTCTKTNNVSFGSAATANGDGYTISVAGGVIRGGAISEFDPDVMQSVVNNTAFCQFQGSFTGSASGTTLTVTSVTGGIVLIPGSILTGTGIGANVTIVSQTNGTTYGAGVYVTSASTTFSGSGTFKSQYNEATGLDCAAQNAAQYYANTPQHLGSIIRAHATSYNLTYPVTLPQRSYNSNTVQIIGEPGCSITAIAPMAVMFALNPTTPSAAAPGFLNCSLNGNFLAQQGLKFDNSFNSRVENSNFYNFDWKSGAGNNSEEVSCVGCGNEHWKNNTFGNPGGAFTGTLADISVTSVGGQIATFFIGQKAYAIASSGGSGGVVGTYNWTTSANGSNNCSGSPTGGGVYPSGTLTVTTAGSGYASGTVTNKGMWCNSPGLTITVAGSPGVTGATNTLSMDSGMRGIGIVNDVYGVPSVAHLYYYNAGARGNGLLPCTTMPAQYPSSSPLYFQQVTEPTINLDGNGSPTTIAFSGTHTEAGCPNTMYALLNTGSTAYTLSRFDASDGGADDSWFQGGALVDLVAGGGNPQFNRMHFQGNVGLQGSSGYGSAYATEIDSTLIAGIQITGSYWNLTNSWYAWNQAGDYPGTVAIAVATTNSSQNTVITNTAVSGLPADGGDFLPFANAGGAFNVALPTFLQGQIISNWRHSPQEPGVAQEIINEQFTNSIGNSGEYVLATTTTATTPLNPNTLANTVTLASNFTFTLGTPFHNTQPVETCVNFVGSGSYTVATTSASVRGLFSIPSGETASANNNQECFQWKPSLSLWLAKDFGRTAY